MIPSPAIPTNCPICCATVSPDSFQPFIHRCPKEHYHYVAAGFIIQGYVVGSFMYELVHAPTKIRFYVYEASRRYPRQNILEGKLQVAPTVEEIVATLERVAKVHCMV